MWHPIETVPRGDSFLTTPEVLLCWKYPEGCGRPITRIGRFFIESYPEKRLMFKLELDYGDSGGWCFTDRDDQPTHWMHIPEPPND